METKTKTDTPKKKTAKKSTQAATKKATVPATMPEIKATFRPSPAIQRDAARPCSLACLCQALDIPGAENLTSWKKLYNAEGRLILPLVELSPAAKKRRAAAGYIASGKFALSVAITEACLAKYETSPEFTRVLKQWGSGMVAGYTRRNPERVACQLLAWGIDDTPADFALETPKTWERRYGCKLKENARPIFLVTPLFSDEEKDKAEAEGAALIPGEITIKKGKRKYYAVHAVYAREDVEQVREIKRRPRKTQKNTEKADAFFTEPEPVKKPKKAAKKPAAKETAPPAPALSPSFAQLALGF